MKEREKGRRKKKNREPKKSTGRDGGLTVKKTST
jgi:hypothetical protein